MEEDLQKHQSIVDQLDDLHNNLNNKRTLTKYTANEGRNIAQRAITLIKSFPDDNPSVVGVKPEALKMLKEAISIADEFYNNYDYMNQKPKPSAPDPWKAVIKTQDAIEYFIAAVVESY